MSDLLTHWAVFDDCCRLAQHDITVEPALNSVLSEQREVARLGAITRAASKWMPPLLAQARHSGTGPAGDTRTRQRLAFALGGLLHFPADKVLKPLMSELARADWNTTHHQMQGQAVDAAVPTDAASIREVSAYFDCHVFRKVYLSGHEQPFSRFLVAGNTTEPGRALEAFVRALFQRALLSSHTLAPAGDDFDGWLDNLLDRVQPLYLDIELYVRVFQAPDPRKLAQYRVDVDFYRDDDPLIGLARAIQHGSRPQQSELEQALAAPSHSSYATCLALGLGLLRDLSAYWRGEAEQLPDVRQSMRNRL